MRLCETPNPSPNSGSHPIPIKVLTLLCLLRSPCPNCQLPGQGKARQGIIILFLSLSLYPTPLARKHFTPLQWWAISEIDGSVPILIINQCQVFCQVHPDLEILVSLAFRADTNTNTNSDGQYQILNFSPNFELFAKFSTYCQIFNFLPNLQLFAKFSTFCQFINFSPIFQFLSNFHIFIKFQLFIKFSTFCQLFSFLSIF